MRVRKIENKIGGGSVKTRGGFLGLRLKNTGVGLGWAGLAEKEKDTKYCSKIWFICLVKNMEEAGKQASKQRSKREMRVNKW